MPTYYNPEISHYLTSCYQTIKKTAREQAAASLENHPLHSMPLMERYAVLCQLLEQNEQQAAAFDRQEYLSKGGQPQFLLKHFTSGNRYFSFSEQEKYQEAMIITEMRKAIDYLLAVTGLRIELQRIEKWMAEAISQEKQPDPSQTDHYNYLHSQLELLLSHGPDTIQESRPKARRGPAKKCAFGYQGTLELLRSIVDGLNAAVGFLRLPTTTQDFIKVVCAPVPSVVGIPIYIGCNNKQLVYIMDYFHALFLSFEAATIGNSGLFFSKEGHLFNSHNLCCTVCDHVEKRYAIDTVFKKHGIAMPKDRERKAAVKKQGPVSALPGSGGF